MFIASYLPGCGGSGGGATANSPPQQGTTANTTPQQGTTANTAPQQDITKPTVVSTTPAYKSVTVNTNSAITVTFNEPVEPAPTATNTFIVVADVTGATVTGTVQYDQSSKTATFRHDGLSPNTAYTATVTTGIQDLAGNAMAGNYSWQFITGEAPDNTAPNMVATFPALNAGSAAMNTTVAVIFSEAIDPATINAQTFILMKDGATPVTGSVTYVGATAQFKPADNLLSGASYTAIITNGVKDLAGNPLAGNFSWVFTTGSVADMQAPQVLSTSPPTGAQNVPVDSPIVVTFNEPIMPFEFGLINGRPVAVTFNDTFTTVTMKPTAAWLSGTTYATIRAQDMAGNLMPAAFIWQFSTSP